MRLSCGVQATEHRDVHQKGLRAQTKAEAARRPRRMVKGEEGKVKVRVCGHRQSSEFEGCGQRVRS